MIQVSVALHEQTYPVLIAPGLLEQPSHWLPYINQEVFIISNTVVAPLYLPQLRRALADRICHEYLLPDGEAHKTLTEWQAILDALLAKRCTRQVTLIALGGGVVGDITGFAAAVYQRGVSFVQMPTTLLAQVDASVGGKTAVNHPLGKNMIGAFHQPRAVVIDPLTLNTLPDREFAAGLAEVIKYGLIADRHFFDWLLAHATELSQRDPVALEHVIAECCRLKAAVVSQDANEQGLRAVLNFGHTFAHAIESGTHYQRYLHGEAVAIGMLMAMRLSQGLTNRITDEQCAQVQDWLQLMGLPVVLDAACDLTPQQLLMAMQYDKKVQRSGCLRFVVLAAIGRAQVVEIADERQVLSILSHYC